MADEEEWRFSVDEVGDDTDTADPGEGAESDSASDEWAVTIGADDDAPTVRVGDHDEADDGGEGGNVAESLTPDVPVESGTPAVENVVFVTAGVLITVLVLGSLLISNPFVLGGLGIAIILASGGLYLLFTRY